MESFRSMLKRAHKGTFHRLSPKHLQRYVNEFAGRHNIWNRDTIDQMTAIVAGQGGERLMYQEMIPPAGRNVGGGVDNWGGFAYFLGGRAAGGPP
ncbi:MAG: transposase, partial [Rhodobacteraceae bacterium]|nr:transposase [Paracoccaceae bacterium]